MFLLAGVKYEPRRTYMWLIAGRRLRRRQWLRDNCAPAYIRLEHVMDLNYLLARHQISLMRAAEAPSCEARHAHRGLARGYAARIRELQDRLGGALSPLQAG